MIKIDITTNYGIVNLFSYGKDSLPEYKNEDWTQYTKTSVSELFNHPKESIFCLNQVHGKEIISIQKDSDISKFYQSDSPANSVPDADGLVTTLDSKILTIRTADCVPVLIWSYDTPFIAALHIGWKGASIGMLTSFLDTYTKPSDKLGFYIGPSISAENYEVGEDVANLFSNTKSIAPSIHGNPGHFQLDLCKFIATQIRERFPAAMLLDSGEDTFHSNNWFSHRAGELGRNLHGIRFFALS
ncbi:MAG: polyphenol oxidase family protein [Leptospira sp.]|nr:polyphenol oxidase family protein [Leptospira sp.]